MKMIFKVLAISCVLALVVTCFSACGKKDKDNSSQTGNVSSGEKKTSYYVDEETGDIKDFNTREEITDKNIVVDENTGNIIDKTTSEIIQTKEETDKIGAETKVTTVPGDHGPIVSY